MMSEVGVLNINGRMYASMERAGEYSFIPIVYKAAPCASWPPLRILGAVDLLGRRPSRARYLACRSTMEHRYYGDRRIIVLHKFGVR